MISRWTYPMVPDMMAAEAKNRAVHTSFNHIYRHRDVSLAR